MADTTQPPPARELTYWQYSGWACCWCGKSLLNVAGAVPAGISRGHSGAHVLDVEVYACPACATAPNPREEAPT